MSLTTTVQGGTNAGIRKPFTQGHGPNCVCSRCLPYPDGAIIYVPPKTGA